MARVGPRQPRPTHELDHSPQTILLATEHRAAHELRALPPRTVVVPHQERRQVGGTGRRGAAVHHQPQAAGRSHRRWPRAHRRRHHRAGSLAGMHCAHRPRTPRSTASYFRSATASSRTYLELPGGRTVGSATPSCRLPPMAEQHQYGHTGGQKQQTHGHHGGQATEAGVGQRLPVVP